MFFSTLLIPLLFLFFFLGIPIAFSLGIVSTIGLVASGIPLITIVQRMYDMLDSFIFVAAPLFMLTGELMGHGGITNRLIRFADTLVGHIHGGLVHVTIVASMFFAGVSGSAISDTAAVGGVMIPSMIKKGFGKPFAASIQATAGSIGPIIPPSVPMVIYGVMGNVSIGALFMGGIFPGIMMGVFLMVVSYFISKKRGYAGKEKRSTVKEIILAGWDALFPLFMPFIIVGGIISGIFTATESAVVAVVYGLSLGLINGNLNYHNIRKALISAGLLSGSITFIVASASLFVWLLTIHQIPQKLTIFLMSITENKILLLLIINIILLIVGTFIDTLSAIIIFTPLLLPVVTAFGVNPIHFGLILVVNLTIGMCTPPVGVCLFVACGIAKIPLGSMFKDLIPLILFLIMVLGIVTYIPAIAMYLPNLYFKSF
jgi:C4-dicarboxylate transporter DctM subunit